MSWIIIGSTAAHHWFPRHFSAAKDIDVLTDSEISIPNKGIVDVSNHELAAKLIERSADKVFADARILYTLKLSHAHWDINWDKTMFHINQFWELGVEPHEDLYEELVKMWERSPIHKAKQVNLKQPVDDFFADQVKRKWNHELLHEVVASPNRPMHERIRPDHKLAWCDQRLFENLSVMEKVRTVQEELIVVAIERYDLTAESSAFSRKRAVLGAYKKLCTTMTKGWFARFMIEHYVTILFKLDQQWKSLLDTTLLTLKQGKFHG